MGDEESALVLGQELGAIPDCRGLPTLLCSCHDAVQERNLRRALLPDIPLKVRS